jgi:anti-sigma-K factor RskA
VTNRSTHEHVADEDFVLDYYGELDASERERVRTHLAWCGACQLVDQEVRATLRMVDVTPPPEPPPSFEREMWARIAPQLPSGRPAPSVRARLTALWQAGSWRRPQVAWAGGVAVALVAAFFVGRGWRLEPVAPQTAGAGAAVMAARERVLDAEVEEHFERTQRVLSSLVDADVSAVELASDRARAAELVAAGRVYRRSADALGEAATSELLEDVERVLLDVANSAPESAPDELRDVQARIDQQDLVFRLRVVGAELRRRQRPATQSY